VLPAISKGSAMQQAQKVETIIPGVNEGHFIAQIKNFFTNSTSALGEAMQNARRAGANSVTFDFNAKKKILTITDDGSGIPDFQDLLTIAKSGWNEATEKQERPFGIGFMAVCFTGDRVTVLSRGKKVSFTPDDVIDKTEILVEPSQFIGAGCQVIIKGCKLTAREIELALERFARGFPIDTVWNGKKLPNPHALCNLKGVETKIGFIHEPSIHDGVKRNYCDTGFVYCQGLPVVVGNFASYHECPWLDYTTKELTIIHLDELKYQSRLPDRDCLRDSKKAEKDFVGVLKSLWLKFLRQQKKVLSDVDFAERHWRNAEAVDALDLMLDVPLLPNEILRVPESGNWRRYDNTCCFTRANFAVKQSDVESGKQIVCLPFEPEYYDDGFARLAWAQSSNAVFLEEKELIPEGHWVLPHLLDLGVAKIDIMGNLIASAYFDGSWVCGEVKLMESIMVSINGNNQQIPSAIAGGSFGNFLVPKGENYPGHVVHQVSSYTDECENYLKGEFTRDSNDFDDLVASLSGEVGDATLHKCLRKGDALHKPNLRGKSFLVTFGEDGKYEVKQQ
jgi:hypothetical protein